MNHTQYKMDVLIHLHPPDKNQPWCNIQCFVMTCGVIGMNGSPGSTYDGKGLSSQPWRNDVRLVHGERHRAEGTMTNQMGR